ncbi:hypothetical protein A6V29_18620 [Blastococcus sp. CCUG 61487]|nr:hypothetical protein A6V29_18620 [Blastococcus sp. CCUG 61487]
MSPGSVASRMGGAGAPTTPDEAADTVIWLATLPEDGPTNGFFYQRQRIRGDRPEAATVPTMRQTLDCRSGSVKGRWPARLPHGWRPCPLPRIAPGRQLMILRLFSDRPGHGE